MDGAGQAVLEECRAVAEMAFGTQGPKAKRPKKVLTPEQTADVALKKAKKGLLANIKGCR